MFFLTLILHILKAQMPPVESLLSLSCVFSFFLLNETLNNVLSVCILIVRVVVLPPVMLFLEAQYLFDFPIAQRRFPLSHLPRNGRVGRKLL